MDNPQTPPHRPPDGSSGDGHGANGVGGGPDDDLYAGTEGPDPVEDWGARYGQDAPPPPPRGGIDPSALFVLLDALRQAAPADLQDRVTNLIRELLLTLRSLIDWYLERLDDTPQEPKVEDIPID
jgi:hypothetical protein